MFVYLFTIDCFLSPARASRAEFQRHIFIYILAFSLTGCLLSPGKSLDLFKATTTEFNIFFSPPTPPCLVHTVSKILLSFAPAEKPLCLINNGIFYLLGFPFNWQIILDKEAISIFNYLYVKGNRDLIGLVLVTSDLSSLIPSFLFN